MRKKLLATAALLAGLLAGPATAATNFTTNFDDFVIGGAGWGTFSSIQGWTGGPLGIEVQSNGVAGAPDTGTNLIELDTSGNSSMFRTIEAGVYSLSFAYSARPGIASASNKIGVFLGGVQLGPTYTASGVGKSTTNWLSIEDLTFTVLTSTVLSFAALGTSDGAGGYIDSISLIGSALPVPEPAEWAMLAAGLGVVGFIGTRRRNNV